MQRGVIKVDRVLHLHSAAFFQPSPEIATAAEQVHPPQHGLGYLSPKPKALPQLLVDERPDERAKLAGRRPFGPDVEAVAAAIPVVGGLDRLLSEDPHLASSDNCGGVEHLKLLSKQELVGLAAGLKGGKALQAPDGDGHLGVIKVGHNTRLEQIAFAGGTKDGIADPIVLPNPAVGIRLEAVVAGTSAELQIALLQGQEGAVAGAVLLPDEKLGLRCLLGRRTKGHVDFAGHIPHQQRFRILETIAVVGEEQLEL